MILWSLLRFPVWLGICTVFENVLHVLECILDLFGSVCIDIK